MKKKQTTIKQESKEESETKPYDPLKPKGWLDFKGWYKKFKDNSDSRSTYLINMELRNGMSDLFIVFAKKDKFSYLGGNYIIDNDLKYYVASAKMYCLDYHQNCTIPIRRKIPFNDINKTIDNLTGLEIETALNPYTLNKFIESSVIEKVMQGHEMSEWMKRMMLILVITCLSSVIMLITFIIKSGMLQNVKIPGIN